MRKTAYATAFASVLWAAATALPAQAAMVPAGGELDFTVLRDGADVGSHRIDFHRNGDQLEVDIKTRIAVKLAFITVFRFEHDGHEVWQDNKLVAMQTKTHDDGDDHTLVATANGDGELDIVGDGQERTAKGSVIPASLWNHTFLESRELLNSLVGTDLNIDVAYKGEEQVKVNGAEVTAKHYSMTGEFERELWYDKDRVLVKIAFKAEDGSDIQYVRR
jgi:hypothetical protein